MQIFAIFITKLLNVKCVYFPKIGWMIAALRDGLLETIFIALFFSLTQEFSSGNLFC